MSKISKSPASEDREKEEASLASDSLDPSLSRDSRLKVTGQAPAGHAIHFQHIEVRYICFDPSRHLDTRQNHRQDPAVAKLEMICTGELIGKSLDLRVLLLYLLIQLLDKCILLCRIGSISG